MVWSSDIIESLKSITTFLGTFPKDRLPMIKSLPCSLVMNTHSSNQPGEHWVAVYINKKGFGEYFDPYGFEPFVVEFREFLDKYCSDGWTYNRQTIQGLTSIKCGEFCVVFIQLKSLYKFSMFQIVNIFSKSNQNINDVILEYIYPYFTKQKAIKRK
jgi:hypothetical protein